MADILERRFSEMKQVLSTLGPLDIPPELIAHRQQDIAREEARALAAHERRVGIVRSRVPPGRTVDIDVRRVASLAGEMPVSVRAWHETVGGVNLVGSHPELAPPGVDCDPFFVAPIQAVLDLCQAWAQDHASEGVLQPFQLPISPHRTVKAGGSTEAPLYVVTLPNGGLDAIVENEAHCLHFVDYLRLALEWGGFPGYADAPAEAPSMIASLRDGLLPL